MKYIMHKSNMSVVVDNREERRKMEKKGFTLLQRAADYEHAKSIVKRHAAGLGYKGLEEIR